MAPTKVLMVAEKPSIANSIASVLSRGQMHTRKGTTEVHEFDGTFLGIQARYKVTSVIGHVFSVDFPAKYQDWSAIDPLELFEAPIQKTESNPKAHVCRHLGQEARGCDHLVLWLDCDREGENICFEVMECTGFPKNGRRRVHRARFSSVTEKDILKAMDNLVEPNKDEALAVDARQEIDLKVGVAFTRFQTSYFQGKYGNLDSRVISYGPCQTPTLGFCVQRYLQITTFKPEKFWSLHPQIITDGYELQLEWERLRLFDYDAAIMLQRLVLQDGILEVTDVSEKSETKVRPSGLNTVNLLKVASSALGFGPQMAMQLAERLYTQGYISYPRTESTAYPSSFDFEGTISALTNNQSFGDHVRQLLTEGYNKARSGTDAGDHPPITPMRSASEDLLGKDAWRLYQYVCQHFLGTVSPDCKYMSWHVMVSLPSGEVVDPPHSLRPAEEFSLDQGGLEIEGQLPEKSHCYEGVFYNYFSIGMDAQVAYGFHHLRNEKPYLAQGPISNKLIYSGYSCTQGWFLTPCMSDPSLRGLKNILRLYVKKVNCSDWELIPVPKSVRAIVALNLHNYGSGRNPWGTPNPEYLEKRGFVEAHVDDGLLEIFGLKQGWHASFVMGEFISAKHIAQAAAIRLEMRGGEWKDAFMQMDGEPWKQPMNKEYSSFVEIKRLPYQSLMISGE